jgi:hypothetical protein
MEETRITGRFPALNMEIDHVAEDGREVMTIRLTATPDFEAALPLAVNLLTNLPAMNPMALWLQAMQSWMTPWQALMAPTFGQLPGFRPQPGKPDVP